MSAFKILERRNRINDDETSRVGHRGGEVDLKNVTFRYSSRGGDGADVDEEREPLVPVVSASEVPSLRKTLSLPRPKKPDSSTPTDAPPSYARAVYQNLSLSIPDGKSIAIVGPSGCGKSTILSLLLRFYDIQSGSVSVNRLDVRNWRLSALREAMSIVSQEPVLLNLSIRENIAYGVPDVGVVGGSKGVVMKGGMVPEEDIIAAAKRANAHDFIVGLAEGYDTIVGERATQLSGGQRQRIAIARALIREPSLLLLDEATSSLDSESEKLVQSSLDAASRSGCTTITIAHRLSTIQDADCIVVMDAGGEIVEMGGHEELLERDGLYAKLVLVQSLDEGL
ncbi:hypothetical protein HK102_001425 [Quaeritorhiza haematococci]|nr:hypothetical protein HK102_001425 [Quaeritorhiza haematococci]